MRTRFLTLAAFCAWFVFNGSACGPNAKVPSVPALNGPSSGVFGLALTFKVMSVDENEDTIAYMVDWGDTTHAKWTAFAQSGESVSVSHLYWDSGGCSIKAKARNGAGAESEWSEKHPLQVVGAGPGYPDSLRMKQTLPHQILSITLSIDGRYLYASLYGVSMLDVIRMADGALIDSIALRGRPAGIVLSPDGSNLYAAEPGLDSVVTIRTSDNAVIGSTALQGNPRKLAVAPSGARLYSIPAQDDTVRVLDLTSGGQIAAIAVGGVPLDIAMSPDGSKAYVASGNDSTLVVVGTQTNAVQSRLKMPSEAVSTCSSPDGSRVYVGTNSRGICAADANGSEIIGTAVPIHGMPNDIAITPDGLYLVAANGVYEGLPVLSTAGSAALGLLYSGWAADYVTVTSDGKEVVCASLLGQVWSFARRGTILQEAPGNPAGLPRAASPKHCGPRAEPREM